MTRFKPLLTHICVWLWRFALPISQTHHPLCYMRYVNIRTVIYQFEKFHEHINTKCVWLSWFLKKPILHTNNVFLYVRFYRHPGHVMFGNHWWWWREIISGCHSWQDLRFLRSISLHDEYTVHRSQICYTSWKRWSKQIGETSPYHIQPIMFACDIVWFWDRFLFAKDQNIISKLLRTPRLRMCLFTTLFGWNRQLNCAAYTNSSIIKTTIGCSIVKHTSVRSNTKLI